MALFLIDQSVKSTFFVFGTVSSTEFVAICRGKAFLHRFIQKLELLAESGWSELSETVSGVCLGQWKHNELFIFKVSETFFHPFLTQKQSVIQKKISFHNEKTKFFVKLQIQVKSSKHTKKCAADAGG